MNKPTWLPLRLASSAGAVTGMLQQFLATDTAYTLIVTDLTHAWIDSPTHDEIIQRAEVIYHLLVFHEFMCIGAYCIRC